MATSAEQVFQVMGQAVNDVGPTLVPKIKGVIKFDIDKAGAWIVDLKNGNGDVRKASDSDKQDITISLSEENFLKMIANKLNPQQAFMKGLVKIKGNMGLAMKLNVVIKATQDYMKKQKSSDGNATSKETSNLKSAALFQALDDAVKSNGKEMASKVKGVIQFNITPGGAWNVDLKSSSPSVTKGEKPADVTLTVADEDFVAIASGKLNPQQAFMKGKLKMKGNMALAMKLPVVLKQLQPQSKL